MLEGEAGKAVVPNVAVCCPATEQVASLFCFDFARMMGATIRTRPEIALRSFMMPGSLIAKQREMLTLEVLKLPEITHILWLDTDMRFPPSTLLQLLDRGQRIVAANYVERRPPFKPIAFPDLAHSDVRRFTDPTDTGLEAMHAVGFGCVLIETAVFRKLPRPWFCVGWVEATQEYVGEDVFFSETARRNGETIYIDHDLSQSVSHIGSFEITMANARQYQALEVPAPSGNGHDPTTPERVLTLVSP